MRRTSLILTLAVLLLSATGIIMLLSTSAIPAQAKHGDPNYFFNRQLAYLIVGMVGMFSAYFVDYRLLRRYAWLIAVIALAGLLIVLIPGVGLKLNGSRRWVRVFGITAQPSEFAKFAMIVLLAWWMSLKGGRRAGAIFSWRPLATIKAVIEEGCRPEKIWPGLATSCAILGLFVVPIIAEPDFGTTFVCAAVGLMLIYVGGARLAHLSVVGLLGFLSVSALIMHNPNRVQRFLAFLDPEKYREGEAFQLLNAMYAFVKGGGGGVGFGESIQKQFYLPEAYADFIFPIIGEELGLGASLIVIALFLTLFICGLKISAAAPDNFGRLVAFGITVLITLQAAFNIAVVTGCVPTKGLTLPFISYGGTSLITTLCMIGVLLNIAREADADQARIITAIKDRQTVWHEQ